MKPEKQTMSGTRIKFLDPGSYTYEIEEIAMALSKLCRFTGHCRGHYSVAQHSVLVSTIVSPEQALSALLHDASEAYTGDINKPLKMLLGKEFKEIEDSITAAIYEQFGLPLTCSEEVHDADLIAVLTEKRDLMPHDPIPWSFEAEYEDRLREETINPMSWEVAYYYFMKRYTELTK